MKATEKQDFWSGLIFIAFGLLFALIARNYPMGTAVRMGPAYFPTILGWVLVTLGAITTGRSFIPKVAEEEVPKLIMRPLFWITLSVVVFGLAVDSLGVIAATVAMTFIVCVAGAQFNWKEAAVLSVVLCIMTVAIFVYGLGLPFRMWPSFGG